jgi:tRNA modification GTPase
MVESADLVVWNKADVPWPGPPTDIRVSAVTGEGLDDLLDALADLARARLDRPRESPPLSRARHRHALTDAATALDRASQTDEPELMAEDLRLALRAIGRITGRVDIEDLRGEVSGIMRLSQQWNCGLDASVKSRPCW